MTTTFTTTATITCARAHMEASPKAHILFQTAGCCVGGISYDLSNADDYRQVRQLSKLFEKDFLEDLVGTEVRLIATSTERNPMCVDALAIGHLTANVFYLRDGDGTSLTYEDAISKLRVQ